MSNPRHDIEKEISSEYLNEIFRYDEATGHLIHKRVQRGIQTGKVAGNNNTYINVKINGRLYRSHRVIWCMVHGVWPEDIMDHINGDKHDNRLSNLREANRRQNGANQPSQPSNTGYRNISWVKSANAYRVRMRTGGRRISKLRVNLNDAIKLAEEMSQQHHGVFASDEVRRDV